MSEWTNFGDEHFSDYGGVMVREAENPGEYEYFQVSVDESANKVVKYAFLGNICIADYADQDCIERCAVENGYKDAKRFIEAEPDRVTAELIEWYGAIQLGAVNKDKMPSTDIKGFEISENEIEEVMKNLDIPTKYWPVFEYELTSMYEEDKGIEDTFKTNDWSEVETWSHEKASNGNFVRIEDVNYGQRATLDPDRYIETFELRNGEFPVDERYFSVEYGDEKGGTI